MLNFIKEKMNNFYNKCVKMKKGFITYRKNHPLLDGFLYLIEIVWHLFSIMLTILDIKRYSIKIKSMFKK